MRPRLIERLNAGQDHKMTLISAPVGFGKTTLVSEWVEDLRQNTNNNHQNNKIAWLSLEENDNEIIRFLTYSNQWDVEALIATTSVHQPDKIAAIGEAFSLHSRLRWPR